MAQKGCWSLHGGLKWPRRGLRGFPPSLSQAEGSSSLITTMVWSRSKKESPQKSLCALPHPFPSLGMLGWGSVFCSYGQRHPLGLQVRQTLLGAQLCPLGRFLPRLGLTCNGTGAPSMALWLICEANRRVSSSWSLTVSEPVLRRPAPGLVASS